MMWRWRRWRKLAERGQVVDGEVPRNQGIIHERWQCPRASHHACLRTFGEEDRNHTGMIVGHRCMTQHCDTYSAGCWTGPGKPNSSPAAGSNPGWGGA